MRIILVNALLALIVYSKDKICQWLIYIFQEIKSSVLDKFFTLEQMGVSCTPKCGSCRCGRCPVGGKDFTIKEEKELQLISKGLIHKGDHWEASYPWCKDPKLLPNNREIVLKMLESTEKRLSKDPVKANILIYIIYNR